MAGPTYVLISPTDGGTYASLSDVRVRVIDPAGISLDPGHHISFFDDYAGKPMAESWYWVTLISGTIYDGIWKLDPADPANVGQGWTPRTTQGTYHFWFGAHNLNGEDGWIEGTYTIGPPNRRVQITAKIKNTGTVTSTFALFYAAGSTARGQWFGPGYYRDLNDVCAVSNTPGPWWDTAFCCITLNPNQEATIIRIIEIPAAEASWVKDALVDVRQQADCLQEHILASQFLTGVINIASASVNLAVIPDDWGDYAGRIIYDGGPQICFLDSNVVRTAGKPSIRIDQHTAADFNTAREVDGKWYSVKPGDHIVFKCWEKTGLSQNPAYNSDPTDSFGVGARIGMDFYSDTANLGIGALVNGLGSSTVTIPGYPQLQSAGSDVPCNTTVWTQQVIDFIVPSGYGITQIVGWMQMRPESGDSVQGWFADAELYLDPAPLGRTVTWADGTAETLSIDKWGRVSLNGQEKIAIGFHVKHGYYNPSQIVAESMLQRLSSDGIRFMVFNFAHWETDAQVLYDIDFWMPLLYKYKMWTFLQVQHIDPEPPILSVSYQLPRHQLVINKICQNNAWANMIYACTVGWELDIWFHDPEVTAYLQEMVPSVKNLLQNSIIGDVPILNKPCGTWGWDKNYGELPMGIYADLMGLDHYTQVTAAGSGQEDGASTETMRVFYGDYSAACDKVGCRAWHTEWGVFNYGLNNEVTPALFSQMLNGMGYGPCGSIILWLMWTQQIDNHSAFNPDGTPKQWYSTLAPLFS